MDEPIREEVAPYLGLRRAGHIELVIKKSRFIGYAWPVESGEEAEQRLAEIREEHPTARHVCFAYRAGLKTEQTRFSDDGEPGGTAGKPILEVLLQKEVRNAVVAVVRYFGGVLLGAPGLVRAYSQAASQAVVAAEPVTMVPHRILRVSVGYALLGRLRHLLGELGAIEEGAEFGERVLLRLAMPQEVLGRWYRELEGLGPDVEWVDEERTLFRPES